MSDAPNPNPAATQASKPAAQGTQQMTAPVSGLTHMVKAKVNWPIYIKSQDRYAGPGEVIDITEPEAKEFCDRVFVGNFGYSGEHDDRFAEDHRHKMTRAERIRA